MDLKPVKCPDCGADIQVPEGKDVVTCEYCGASISVREITGGNDENINNFMSLAKASLEGGSYKEAIDYYNKVLEVDSSNADAWYGKAQSAG